MPLRLTISQFDRISLSRTELDEAAYVKAAGRGWYGQARRIIKAAKDSPGLYQLWTADNIFSLLSELDDDADRERTV